jgi:hypothetical protein
MFKCMLRAGLLLVTLGAPGLAQADVYGTAGTVIGAAQLADQSILVLPVPGSPTVNSTLALLGQQKISQPALYTPAGSNSTVAISLDCAQVQYNMFQPYSSWQEFSASGKGSDGKMYAIHMTSLHLETGGYFSGYPLSYLVLTPAMRANLPASLATAVGLIDLQMMAAYGTVGYMGSNQIGYLASVNVTVSNHVAAVRSTANQCGVIDGGYERDPWVLSGLFVLAGLNGLNIPIGLP